MLTTGWLLGSLVIAILVLTIFIFLFQKKKTMPFYLKLIAFLTIVAIFLYGIWFKLH